MSRLNRQKACTALTAAPSSNFAVCAASLHRLVLLLRLPLPLLLLCVARSSSLSFASTCCALSSIYFSFSFVLICRLIHCDSIAVVVVLAAAAAVDAASASASAAAASSAYVISRISCKVTTFSACSGSSRGKGSSSCNTHMLRPEDKTVQRQRR